MKLYHSDIEVLKKNEQIKVFDLTYKVEDFQNFLYFYVEKQGYFSIKFFGTEIFFVNGSKQVHFKLEEIN